MWQRVLRDVFFCFILFINQVVFVDCCLCYYLLAPKCLVADWYEVCRTHYERGVILVVLIVGMEYIGKGVGYRLP